MQNGKGRRKIFKKLRKGLTKTRENLSGKIDSLLGKSKHLDDDFFEELEEILIQGDLGVDTSVDMVENLRRQARRKTITTPVEARQALQELIAESLSHSGGRLCAVSDGLTVYLVVGVNGAGKTTTIAKLAKRLKSEGSKVMLAAGDTFRAAAIDQLQVWADRVGVDLIKQQEGSDPGAVVFDALNAARARRVDVLIIDSAGRLHNKTNLMNEMGKISRIISREIPEAPHEVLLVLDATTGQNAVSQARSFKEVTGVTGIVLTKMDGTAKGGIVIAISKELNIPVKLVGVGEGMDDLEEFDAGEFAEALLAGEGEGV